MSEPSPTPPPIRHWGGFLLSGGTAFIVDSSVTLALVYGAGVDRFVARVIGILVAMVVAWLMHRRITFAVAAPPTLAEFGKFAAVAWSANVLNYIVYAGFIVAWPAIPTLAAVAVATAIAAVFSYLGFRFGVFRQPPPIA